MDVFQFMSESDVKEKMQISVSIDQLLKNDGVLFWEKWTIGPVNPLLSTNIWTTSGQNYWNAIDNSVRRATL